MKKLSTFLLLTFMTTTLLLSQGRVDDANFSLALPSHSGRLQWQAKGFTIVESSAKPGGNEIGIRGKDGSGQLNFLGFLFLVPEHAPLTSRKCRDGALESEKKGNPTFKVQATSEITSYDPPVTVTTYTVQGRGGKAAYIVRAFVAAGDICGDLEFYSDAPISAEDPGLKTILQTYHFDPNYSPKFEDVLEYAQILYAHSQFGAAAPIFEQALTKLPNDDSQEKMRRVTTDQAGMAYGISGNIRKAREIFQQAIDRDPDYPLYYYNLACADAQEQKLADARTHLQQAFARKANVIPGETMPDPAKDDSFLPYQSNKDFWQFVEGLH
jgi:tetratricopeptide (TPR) repeat protein